MWRSADGRLIAFRFQEANAASAGAAILKAGAERGRIEIAANEDDLVHPLLSGSPGTAGAAIERHVDAVEDEAAVFAGGMEDGFYAGGDAPVRGKQGVDSAN